MTMVDRLAKKWAERAGSIYCDGRSMDDDVFDAIVDEDVRWFLIQIGEELGEVQTSDDEIEYYFRVARAYLRSKAGWLGDEGRSYANRLADIGDL